MMRKAARQNSKVHTADFMSSIDEAILNSDFGEITRLVRSGSGDLFLITCGFHSAVGRGKEDVVRHFISLGISIDSPDPGFGESPLMHSVRNFRSGLVQFLIKEGADVNFQTTATGSTPLHASVSSPSETNFSTSILRYLLAVSDIKLDVYNHDGRTPLMIAIKHGRPEAVELLAAAGADVHLRMPNYGSTAAHLCFDLFNPCRNVESANCLKVLLKYGLSPDVVHNGETPIFMAIRKNNVPALKVLIDANCDLNFSSTTWGIKKEAANIRGHEVTPFVLAYHFQKKRAVELLLESGCKYHHLGWLLENGTNTTQEPLHEWFTGCISRPRTLKNLCRITIRSAIGHSIHKKVDKLPLPRTLRDFVILKDTLL